MKVSLNSQQRNILLLRKLSFSKQIFENHAHFRKGTTCSNLGIKNDPCFKHVYILIEYLLSTITNENIGTNPARCACLKQRDAPYCHFLKSSHAYILQVLQFFFFLLLG